MEGSRVLDKMLPVVDEWRARYGEVFATELIRAYLTGVSDGCHVLGALGAEGQHTLFERLKGN